MSARKSNLQKLKNNSDVVEEKKEVTKTRELVSQISHSCLSDPDRSMKNTKTEVSLNFFFKIKNGIGDCVKFWVIEI